MPEKTLQDIPREILEAIIWDKPLPHIEMQECSECGVWYVEKHQCTR